MALLEACMFALPCFKDFIEAFRERAIGTEVSKKFEPWTGFLKMLRGT